MKLDIRWKFFIQRERGTGTACPEKLCVLSLEALNAVLDGVWESLIWWLANSPWQGVRIG